ncbi:hypothetical protein ACXYTJ_06145 [Gilvimarinus sp. F26214L]|uniref:hypothetical protein n=1 Tax=Gilvimarinus sp. DZF01 TaxID=3461371 RepID=UPI00404569E1
MLRFKAPRHAPHFRSTKQERLLPGQDALEGGRLYKTYSNGAMANDFWGFRVPFKRRWAFWGPWMTGAKAELFMSVVVAGRQKGHAFSDISFFNPRAFEVVLLNYLNDAYGHEHWDGRKGHIARFRGPLDWQVYDKLPVPSASFSISHLASDGKTLSSPEYLFVFPISDQHFVEVTFCPEFRWFIRDGKPTFDPSPVQELQDAIFNTITLELSPEAQVSYNKVKSECPNMRLTDTFPPLKWPTKCDEHPSGNHSADSIRDKRLSDH